MQAAPAPVPGVAPRKAYPIERPQGLEHVPLYPFEIIAVRIVQLVLAVIVLGLSGYGVGIASGVLAIQFSSIQFPSISFILAVAVMTLVSSIYHLVSRFAVPAIYNYWAVLGLDIFFVVMWLASFAALAADVNFVASLYGVPVNRWPKEDQTIYGCLAAAAGLGAVNFVLHIATLVFHSIALHRHRAVGLHCMPGQPRTIPGAAPEKSVGVPMQPQQPGVYYAPQPQVYAAPAYQQQPQQQFAPQPMPMYPVPQQQPFYPPTSPVPPISTHPTGGSYTSAVAPAQQQPQQISPQQQPQQMQPQPQAPPSNPNAHQLQGSEPAPYPPTQQ